MVFLTFLYTMLGISAAIALRHMKRTFDARERAKKHDPEVDLSEQEKNMLYDMEVLRRRAKESQAVL